MILLSVFCVVLSLEFRVATPPGNRFKESDLQNEGYNEINVEQNTGEPTNPYDIPNNENELLSQENQKNILVYKENYDNINTNNNPAAFRNVNEQPDVTSESKESNQNTAERNFNNLNDESPRTSYIGSVPQVNRIPNFRPKDGVNHKANMPRTVDILSEVNNPKNYEPSESNAPVIQEINPANQQNNKYTRKDSQTSEIFNDMKEEDTTQFDVPEATPEYTKSLFNENKHTKKDNVKPAITNLPRNDISNKNLQPNSQNENEATFQNPSAEILYETGQAKPYEISNEPLPNTRQGHTHAHHILSDKQRLKNLYLSSKPTKHYMIVYPDGRVEQVDQLDKIQKIHPNYVMLNAKELLQHGKPNQVSTLSQKSVERQNIPTTTATAIKPQLNSIKDTKVDQIEKVPQTVNEQTLPAPIETVPDATEPPTITTEVTNTNTVAKSNEDEVVTKIPTEKNIQNQLQENGLNDSQEKNKLNNNEVTNSEAIVTTADISIIKVSSTSTTESPGNEDTVTTARSTISTPTADTEILNQNTLNSLSTSNNTDSPKLSEEPEDSNSTSGDSLISTKDDSVVAVENTTPIPKQESNEENERTKNTTSVTSDLNTVKENSNTPDNIDRSNVLYDTNTSNSSLVATSANREESNSTTKSNNETVITSKDGTDSDGNTFHTETIITNNNNESSNNVTSSETSTLVKTTNKTEIANSSTENSQDNIKPLNVTSSNSLTNDTLDNPEKDENNIDTITIQNVSNDTKSEVDEIKNDDNNHKPDVNSDPISNIVQESSKYTEDGTDDSDALLAGNPDVYNEEDGNTATDTSNGGAVSSNEEDSDAPDVTSNDSSYLNSPQKGVNEDDEDDDTKNETRPETTNSNDNLDTEAPSSDGNIVNESSIWFNASESFWKQLMNSNEHNSFYFLFPRPQPNTKETKKITYPNGTIVVETTEIIDNDDGETTSSKTVLTCGNCTTCEKTL